MSLTIASMLWYDPAYRHNDKYVYSLGDVKLWRDMVTRNLTIPHEFVCITDQPELFAGTDIRPVPIDKRCVYPNRIFQQLMAFHPDAPELFGPRLLTMDLDVVVTGNLDEIVSRPEPLVLWRNPARVPWLNAKHGYNRALYNTSIMLLDTGAYTGLWEFFVESPKEAMDQYRMGQEYISSVVGVGCAYWNGVHGIYRPNRWDTPGGGIDKGQPLPENSKLVFFPGEQMKPWITDVQDDFPWIREFRH